MPRRPKPPLPGLKSERRAARLAALDELAGHLPDVNEGTLSAMDPAWRRGLERIADTWLEMQARNRGFGLSFDIAADCYGLVTRRLLGGMGSHTPAAWVRSIKALREDDWPAPGCETIAQVKDILNSRKTVEGKFGALYAVAAAGRVDLEVRADTRRGLRRRASGARRTLRDLFNTCVACFGGP